MATGRWKTLTVFALFFFSFQSVAQGQGKASLIGAWQSAGPAGPINLVFESKNRLVFDGEPAKYTLAPGVLRVDDGEGVVDYPYTLIRYRQFGEPGCLLFNGNKLCRSGRCN